MSAAAAKRPGMHDRLEGKHHMLSVWIGQTPRTRREIREAFGHRLTEKHGVGNGTP